MNYKNKYLKYKYKYLHLAGSMQQKKKQKVGDEQTILDDKTQTIINNLTINVTHKQLGSSDSLILRGTYENKKIYCKVFYESSLDLMYEKDIYKYISEEADKNSELVNHFMISPATFTVPLNTFRQKLPPIIISQFDNINNENRFANVNGIITYDYEYRILDDLLFSDLDIDIINDIIFELLYSVYIMNTKLNIIHNDLHFKNVLVKKVVPYEYNYKFDELNYTLTKIKKYNVLIYDFNLSYRNGINNPDLNEDAESLQCKDYGNCNKITNKDVYLILVSIVYKYVNQQYYDRYTTIFHRIVNIKKIEKNIFDNIKKYHKDQDNSLHPYSFCKKIVNNMIEDDNDCILNHTDFNIVNVIKRWLNI
jgi:hypothetical protein